MSDGFNCRCCGHCCTGKGGIVVSPSDLARLCAHLEISAEAFEAAYGERRSEKLHVRAGEDGNCIFFTAGAGCSVHLYKPDICRAWPYFRGNLVDAESLALAKDFCPGIPPDMPFEEFMREGIDYLVRNNLVAGGEPEEAGALRVADIVELLAQNSKSG